MTVALDASTGPAPRNAVTEAPLADPLRARWSPRAFDPSVVLSDESVTTLLEAARWAPSANNSQPWRFAVARRGTDSFAALHAALVGFNQVWADSSSALIVAVAETVDNEGNPRPWAQYDLGQAVAHLTIQAQHDGLHTHQIAGFDAGAVRAALQLPDHLSPVTLVAVGVPGDAAALPTLLQEREIAPRSRLGLDQLVLAID